MLNKKITFIYMTAAEKSLYMPIYDEAKSRGYEVSMTNDPQTKCEIGFYCDHVNFPRNSKFSIIMLHDSVQQNVDWPDIWFKEHWNKYDIGILPDNNWVNNYNQCSQYYYSNPKLGVFKIGWPKADILVKCLDNVDNFKKKYGINNNNKNILYAPSWENDNKQDDLVQAVTNLDVNILVKHGDYDKVTSPQMYNNVMKMEKMHENYKNVFFLPSKSNIFEAIAASDILVSDGSSTMYEAAMANVPSILVTNWLNPGPDLSGLPSSFPDYNYDFVIGTKKEDLKNTINNILNNYEKYKNEITQYSNENFVNIGNTSKIIMDIIDDCVNEKKVRYKPLERKPKQRLKFKRFILTEFWAFCTYFYNKYFVKSKFLTKLSYKIIRFIHSKKIMK